MLASQEEFSSFELVVSVSMHFKFSTVWKDNLLLCYNLEMDFGEDKM